MSMSRRLLLPILLASGLGACGDTANLPVSAGMGRSPMLPPPTQTLIPTVNIAPAKGWPAGARPSPAPGLEVAAFAAGLAHPRWIHVLPNGDVLVAETNKQPSDTSGIKQWIMKKVMGKAGAGVPSADRISILRDDNGDGSVDFRGPFLTGLRSPFGMALVGDQLYVANTDALVRFPYREGETHITAVGEKVVDLPAGDPNRHWTKSLVASPDGRRLYIGVGSNSDHAENGIEKEAGRAAIWEVDVATGAHRVYASGLRNPVGMDWEPGTGSLWVAVNERDELGSDLVPDYMTRVQENAFYGWPYSYYGPHVDTRVEPQRPDLVATAMVPDYALGPHTASLGLAFAKGNSLIPAFRSGVFVGQHGSWNRNPPSGYKVIFVPFTGGKPTGIPVDVLTGFLGPDGDAWGRPVGVAIDRTGSLLVADDVGNLVWRVTAPKANTARSP